MSSQNLFESLKKKNNEIVNGIMKPDNFPENFTASDCNQMGVLNLQLGATISDFKNSSCTEEDLKIALDNVVDIEKQAKSLIRNALKKEAKSDLSKKNKDFDVIYEKEALLHFMRANFKVWYMFFDTKYQLKFIDLLNNYDPELETLEQSKEYIENIAKRYKRFIYRRFSYWIPPVILLVILFSLN